MEWRPRQYILGLLRPGPAITTSSSTLEHFFLNALLATNLHLFDDEGKMFLSAYSTFCQIVFGASALAVLANMIFLAVRFTRGRGSAQEKHVADRDIARSRMSRVRRCDNILAKGRELW
ncbi:hypothetical protein JDV02_002064 [Purpureocillium takamizusanense]|uniref:Uncharacterized protein n=1 Tax=Purpureocillium takamizusanense TaxID=2060973 RepID=A0A9Q8QAL6_9HYPO|nr:uncharacterized protein JDV02_002064 [Purpureocillium takamizusanense]UNI15539.1 hypothetical protein JDV02_002064 [Purpureocillium takamizusanense]